VIAAKKRMQNGEMHVLDAEGVRVVTFRVFRQQWGGHNNQHPSEM
jgi:hypothetical protein